MHLVHAMVAAVAGEISLAMERKSATRGTMIRWIEALRAAADRLESKVNKGETTKPAG